MSASAILSVMMGGALNGASAIDTSALAQNSNGASDDAQAMGAEFAALLGPQDVAEETDTAQVDASNVLLFMPAQPVNAPAQAMMLAQASDAAAADAEDGSSEQADNSALLALANTAATIEDDTLLDAVPAPSQPSSGEADQTDAGLTTQTPLAFAPIQSEATANAAPTSANLPSSLQSQQAQALAQAQSQADDTAVSLPVPQADTASDQAQDNSPTALHSANTTVQATVQAVQQQAAAPTSLQFRKLVEQTEGNAAASTDEDGPVTQVNDSSTASVTTDEAVRAPVAAQPDQPAPLLQQANTDATIEPLVTSPETALAAHAETVAELPHNSQLSLASVRTTAELAAQLIQKMGQRVTRFDMVLTPESLGMVDVSMEVGNDGQIQARMVFDSAASANELRARAEELRRQLSEAGFQIADNALEFTDRESQSRGSFQQFFSDDRSGRRAFAGANRLAQAADTPVAPVWTSVTLTPRGVDLKV